MANAVQTDDEHSGMAWKSSSGTSRFEYLLYSAIIVETALAAFVYKVIFRDADLRSSNMYLGAFYFGFLGWAIFQLNRLHHKRKLQPVEIELEDPPETLQAPVAPAQAAVVVENRKPARRIFGLTATQLLIVLIVFAAAVKSFSWALASMHYDK